MTSGKSSSSDGSTPLAPCPICKKLALKEYAPFCSKRCADVDLNRWLGDNYRLPASEETQWSESEN